MGSRIPASASLAIATVVSILLVLLIAGRANDNDHNNHSAGAAAGLFWSTATEEAADTSNDDSSSSSSIFGDGDDIDGGFSNLDGMLQWAIGHSDPSKLKEAAKDIGRLSPAQLENRRAEIQELMEKLKMPSDAQFMQIAIDRLNNSSLTVEGHSQALQELLELVESIDNANDLNKLGGLIVVMRELSHPDSDIRRLSAWVLGKASQNNPVVQKQILELGALTRLMKMVNSSFVEEAIKALYAVSALIRNNLDGQELFYAEAGNSLLQGILSNSSVDIRICRKAVSLVADLAEYQLEISHKEEFPLFSNHLFLKSVVDLTASVDLDIQERALAAIKILLQLRSTEPLVLEECDLGGALERMKKQFQNLLVEGEDRSYAEDLENLRSEVELIFRKKLDKAVIRPSLQN